MTRTNEVGETRAMGNAVSAADAQHVYPHTMRLRHVQCESPLLR